ncbi:MAG: TerB family tellurite resistance protein [Lentisphaeria bacterium]|nr:TerB family tellurite resistance protein [Lentisphaeria bacterium]
MSQEAFILDLAKLVIAAAWADGELSNDEINALKDLLFNLEEVSGEDWAVLTMYMESPPSDAEAGELLERVLGGIRTSENKVLTLATLENLFRCDGIVTPEEQALLDQVEGDIANIKTGIFSGFSRALKSAIGERNSSVESSLREHSSGDYIRNTIYFDLKRKQDESGTTFNKSESEVRELCFAVGLLAHVANIDAEITSEERQAIRSVIREDWGLSENETHLLVEISCDRTTRGLDYHRLSNGYFECTTWEHRRDFVKTLFRIANAAHKTSNDEIEGIRDMARSLKVSHKDFIAAKKTISNEDRNGL